MGKYIKRMIAGILMSAAVVGVTYAADMFYSPVVMTVNGESVHADTYSAFYINRMKYYENMMLQYGQTDVWQDDTMAATLSGQVQTETMQQVAYSVVLEQKFKEAGLSWTEENQKQFDEAKENLKEQAVQSEMLLTGKEEAEIDPQTAYEKTIAEVGFTEKQYDQVMRVSIYASALNDYYFGENGVEKVTDEGLIEEFKNTYISAKHILISSTDATTGEALPEGEALKKAESALARLNAGEDFDKVMQDTNEDPGMETYPEGYIFTEGDMVDEFYTAAKGLEENQVSEIVATSYGYHIIKRVPINYEEKLEEYRDALLQKTGKSISAKLSLWMEEAQIDGKQIMSEINYKNVYDYAEVEKVTAADIMSSTSETETEEPAEQTAE